MTSFLRGQGESSTESKVTKAEVMVTNFLVQHNLPIATADHLGPLFKAIAKLLHSMLPLERKRRLFLIMLCDHNAMKHLWNTVNPILSRWVLMDPMTVDC